MRGKREKDSTEIGIAWDERNKRMENGKAINFANSTDHCRVMHAKKKEKERNQPARDWFRY